MIGALIGFQLIRVTSSHGALNCRMRFNLPTQSPLVSHGSRLPRVGGTMNGFVGILRIIRREDSANGLSSSSSIGASR